MSLKSSFWQFRDKFPLLLFVFLALLACQPSIAEKENPDPVQASPISATPSPRAIESPTPSPTIELDLRDEPLEYVVQAGDRLSSIAAMFAISSETLLWANADQLFDNPDLLLAGMSLIVLPADGIYHQVGGSDNLDNLAAFFGAERQAIIDWPGNGIDPQAPEIRSGQWLFIPDGVRASRWRAMPNIPRELADIDATEFGSGACLQAYPGGAISNGVYRAPLAAIDILGESYAAWHPGLDLASSSGQAVYAAGAGLVVFSGWSNLGYGKLIMLDHGNGDFSLYSGLSAVIAACGQSVEEGELIARAAITGYPAGPILHFEFRRNGESIDPLTVVSAP